VIQLLPISKIMKKFSFAFLLALPLLAGCSYVHYAPTPKPTKEEVVKQAAERCDTLGFERGTKEFRDCTVNQFNRIMDKL